MGKCAICSEQVEDESTACCPLHQRALVNLRLAHDIWNHAYGSVAFNDFLVRLSMLSETGERARELIEFLARNPERWNH